ncbi:VCBS domain-containing protein [Sulfurospirillum oryzae]|uniref:VCBS domain-containing protein n=1 Tax=Sulfurospirillum oryzae TaxID=2976535 RepID=UPI0021E7C869|nr:VCBS domain-containing protein [Sulfurospirillum oryzae]
MAQVIGYIKSLQNGIFFAKDAHGQIRELKAGDQVFKDELVYGAENNPQNAQVIIDVTLTDAKDIALSGAEQLYTDLSVIGGSFEKEDAVLSTDSLENAWKLSTNTANPDMPLDATAAGVEAPAAGQSPADGDHPNSGIFYDRTGAISDVRTVLAQDTVNGTISQNVTRVDTQDLNDRPVVENVTRTEIEALDGSNKISGQLVASDPDVGDTHTFFAVEGTLLLNGKPAPEGISFVLNQDGSYTVTGDFNHLAVGENAVVSFQYYAVDNGIDVGEPHNSLPATVTITVQGTNDQPVIGDINVNGGEESVVVDTTVESGWGTSYNIGGHAQSFYAAGDNLTEIGIEFSNNQHGSFRFDIFDAEGKIVYSSSAIEVNTGNSNEIVKIDLSGVTLNLKEKYTIDFDAISGDPKIVINNAQNSTDGVGYLYGEGADNTYTYFRDNWDHGMQFIYGGGKAIYETHDGSEGPTHTNDGNNVLTGALSVTDDDTTDTHTFRVVDNSVQVLDKSEAGITLEDVKVSITKGEDGTWQYKIDGDFSKLAAGETATVKFQYVADDGHGFDGKDGINESSVSAPKTITLTITGTNDQPVVSDVTLDSQNEATTGTNTFGGTLLVSDADAHDTHTFHVVENSLHVNSDFVKTPVLELNAQTGAYTVTGDFNALAAGEKATITFQYYAQDNSITQANGESNTSEIKTVTMTIIGTNDAPVISETSVIAGTATEAGNLDDGSVVPAVQTSGTLVATDVDHNAELAWSGSAKGTYGSFAIDPATGKWTYTVDDTVGSAADKLKEGDKVTEKFTVVVTDDQGATATQVVTITINGTNDAPVISGTASGDAAEAGVVTITGVTTPVDAVVATGTLSASDVDHDATHTWSTNATSAEGTNYGTFAIDDKGVWTYTTGDAANQLAEGETKVETFKVTVTDDKGAIDTQDVTITIHGNNDAPVLNSPNALNFSVQEDAANEVKVYNGDIGVKDLATDADNGATLYVGKVNGTLVGKDGFDQPISLSYIDKDGHSASIEAMLHVNQNGSYVISTNNDLNPIPAGVKATATLSFTIADEHGAESAPKTVNLAIEGANDAPVVDLHSDTYAMLYFENGASMPITSGTDISIGDVDSANIQSASIVLANAKAGDFLTYNGVTYDTIVDGKITVDIHQTAPLSAYQDMIKSVAYGSTSENPSAEDRHIEVTVNDGYDNSNTATSTIHVIPVNDAPTTTPVTLAPIAEDSGKHIITQADLLGNAQDAEGDKLTATDLEISAGKGELINNGDGTWTYTPAENDDTAVSFSYKVSDGIDSVNGSATLDITPVNDAPTTTPVALAAVVEDNSRLITQDELLTNAHDIEGDKLTATDLAITAGKGSLVNNGDGTWTYTPAENDDTAVSFSYKITDNGTTNGASDAKSITASATLDITPANDQPVVSDINANQHIKLDFDNTGFTVAETGNGYTAGHIPAGYGGIQWDSNVAVISVKEGANYYGYDNGSTSGASTAFNWSGAPSVGLVFSEAVTFNSTYLTAAVGASTQNVTFNGYLNGVLVDTTTVTINNQTPTLVELNWANIDKLVISDGTVSGQNWWSMDDFTYTLGTEKVVYESMGNLGAMLSDVTTTFTGNLATATDADTSDTHTYGISGTATSTNAHVKDLVVTIVDAVKGDYKVEGNFNALAAGEKAVVTFQYYAVDNSGADNAKSELKTVSLTVTGTNDQPVVENVALASQSEAATGTNTFAGTLVASDEDASDTHTFYAVKDSLHVDSPVALGTPTLVVNTDGTYSVVGDFNHLAQGQTATVTFQYYAVDSSGVGAGDAHNESATSDAKTVTMTITGTNNAAVITGDDIGSVKEDMTTPNLTDSGKLTSTDVDGHDNVFIAGKATPSGDALGSLSIDAQGNWTYTVDNSRVQYLAENEIKTETFTVKAEDGTTHEVVITIVGTNDAPVIAGTFSGNVVEDGQKTATGTLSISDVDTNHNPISFVDKAATVGDNGYGSFSLVNGTWTYTLNNNLASIQSLAEGEKVTDKITFTATDGSNQEVSVTITGTNDAPVFVVGNNQPSYSFNYNENSTTTTVLGTVHATDGDNGSKITYSIVSGNEAGYYAIDSVTGEIKLTTLGVNSFANDFEAATNSHSLVVGAYDGIVTTSINVTLNEQNVNDNPVVLSDANNAANTVAENSATGTVVGVTAFGTDADSGATITKYELTNNADGRFSIDANTGVITVADGSKLDYESATSHTVTVKATSSDGSFTSGDFVIKVTNINDNPVLLSDIDNAVNTVAENSAAGTVVGVTAFGTDADSGATIAKYELTNNADGRFTIDAKTGVITVADGTKLNYESATSHTVTVKATSSDGSFASKDFAIAVTNVNEAPDAVNDMYVINGLRGQYYAYTEGTDGSNLTNIGQVEKFVATHNADATFATTSINYTYIASGNLGGDGNLQKFLGTDASTLSNDPKNSSDAIIKLSGALDLAAGDYTFRVRSDDGFSIVIDGKTVASDDSIHSPRTTDYTVSIAESGTHNISILYWDQGGEAILKVELKNNATDLDFHVLNGASDKLSNLVTNEDTPLTIVPSTLLGNDSDVDGDKLTITSVQGDAATHGTVAIVNGNVVFTPEKDYNGDAVFKYTVSDGNGGTDTATVTLHVNPVNDAPVVTNTPSELFGSVTEDALVTTASGQLGASDVDSGATQSWSIVGTPDTTYGSIGIDSTGKWTYTLDNSLSTTQALAEGETKTLNYTARVMDDKGAYVDQTITVTVKGTNDAPVISGTALGDAVEAGVVTITGVTTPVAAVVATGTLSASDVDNDATHTWSTNATSAEGTNYGTFAIDDKGVWTYTTGDAANQLAEGETKVETFKVTVTDDKGAIDTQDVTITIHGNNDAPVLNSPNALELSVHEENATLNMYTSGSVSLPTLATDVDNGATLHVSKVNGNSVDATNGYDTPLTFSYTDKDGNVATVDATVHIGQDGSYKITYTSSLDGIPEGATATATLNFTIVDEHGAEASAKPVTVTIIGNNDAPVAVADALSATEDTQIIFNASDLLGNDTDVDSASTLLKIASVTSGDNGTAVLNADGTVTFTPNANFSGTAHFTYTTTDGVATSNSATATVNIAPVADAPTLSLVLDTATLVAPPSIATGNGLTQTVYKNFDNTTINSDTLETLTDSLKGGVSTTTTQPYRTGGDGTDNIAERSVEVTKGLIYLEKGTTLAFSGYFDDSFLIELGGKTLISTTGDAYGSYNTANTATTTVGSGTVTSTGVFTASVTGYYTLETYIYNHYGAGDLSINVSVNGATAVALNTTNFKLYTNIAAIDAQHAQHSSLIITAGSDGGVYPIAHAGEYSYDLTVHAALTDGSETLDSVHILTSSLGGATLSGAGVTLVGDHYEIAVTNDTDSHVTLTANHAMSTSDINAISGSVTSTDGTSTATTTETVLNEVTGVTGTDGNDLITGTISSEALSGGKGNDTLVYDSADSKIDGGVGTDTLLFTKNTTIDFSTLDSSTNPIKNIEVLDLTKANVTITNLSLNDVIDMTDTSHTLTILGDAADNVTVDSSTLNKTGTSTEVVNGASHTFDIYTHTNASDPTVTVKIEQDIHHS